MPAPHRGAYPFSSRQMSRLSRQSSSSHSVQPPTMVSPAPSWHQSPTPSSYRAAPTPPNYGRHPASPDPGYATTSSDGTRQAAKGTIPAAATQTTSHHPHAHPANRGGQSPEMKRQRILDNDGQDTTEKRETRDEEDVILFEDPHSKAFSLQDTSLTDGSHQLPLEVESKLSLQDKVISPSGMLQARSTRRPLTTTTTTTTTGNTVSKRLNTSAEEEGLAGLVALSSATFLRLDES